VTIRPPRSPPNKASTSTATTVSEITRTEPPVRPERVLLCARAPVQPWRRSYWALRPWQAALQPVDHPRVLRREGAEPDSTWAVVVVALAVTVGLECVRAFFPVAYSYRERSGLTTTALLVVAVFLAPVLAVPLVRVAGRRWALFVSAAVLGLARLLVQFSTPISVGVAAVSSAVGLLAITIAWLIVPLDGSSRALAVVAGLALDTIVRGVWLTWDLPWHHDAPAVVVSVGLVAVLVGSAWMVGGGASVDHASPAALVALGPFLVLEMLYLQSPAFVASAGGVSLATAVAVVLGADLVALAVLAWRRHESASFRVVAVGGVAVALGAWLFIGVTGTAVLLLVVVLQPMAVCSLAVASRIRRVEPSPAVELMAVLAGSGTFGLVMFLYQLHYDRPLPVSNRWLPVVAAGVLALAAVGARAVPAGTRERRSSFRLLHVGAVAASLGLASVTVFAGLAATEPDLEPAAAGHALRVVTYNIHETVTRDGQLDPEAMAVAVESLHPDVLVLEEAGRGWPLSSGLDLAEWAKWRLGLPYEWAPAADHQFGNVVFSRVPVRHAEVIDLPEGTGTMRRSALIAKVGPVAGKSVTVIGTHLQNGSSPDRHQTRIAEVDALVRAWDHAPHTVLLGDLNSDPASRELRRVLDAGFTTTQDTEHCTMHTSNDNCVDWILVTPDLAQQRVRTLTVDTFDHRPLVSVLAPR
jgi:endonuclease/exonuclease/phosphatase family metal-dependent hydrolase